MTLQEYIVKNYNNLPKSTFNDDSCVIFQVIEDRDEGWGHHSYEGYGMTFDGTLVWCFSSGCSCNGSCGMEHKVSYKLLEVPLAFVSAAEKDFKEIDFEKLQVDFKDY